MADRPDPALPEGARWDGEWLAMPSGFRYRLDLTGLKGKLPNDASTHAIADREAVEASAWLLARSRAEMNPEDGAAGPVRDTADHDGKEARGA